MTQKNTESEQGNYHSAGLMLLPFFVPVFQGFLWLTQLHSSLNSSWLNPTSPDFRGKRNLVTGSLFHNLTLNLSPSILIKYNRTYLLLFTDFFFNNHPHRRLLLCYKSHWSTANFSKVVKRTYVGRKAEPTKSYQSLSEAHCFISAGSLVWHCMPGTAAIPINYSHTNQMLAIVPAEVSTPLGEKWLNTSGRKK